ncbi:MAG: ferritin-like domain-containing protein [Campylobacterales bacterium]|nr:ferritin-like domain-containing protein [Campylobacterales bacterium]
MDFFKTLLSIIQSTTPTSKIERFKAFYRLYRDGAFCLSEEAEAAVVFTHPSYAPFCEVVSPQEVPKRRNLQSPQGQIALLHAIAHIEYSAIDLALDAAYRFRGLPAPFYDDWLQVADDEVRHFEMIQALLQRLGSDYGALCVHDALFEASMRTAHSLLHRMAVVPRYLEAGGLDANEQILERLSRLPRDAMLLSIQEALEVILREEIDHVAKGDRWFAYACAQEGRDKACYFEIIDRYYPATFARKRTINTCARLEAGFTCKELNQIASQQVC